MIKVITSSENQKWLVFETHKDEWEQKSTSGVPSTNSHIFTTYFFLCNSRLVPTDCKSSSSFKVRRGKNVNKINVTIKFAAKSRKAHY